MRDASAGLFMLTENTSLSTVLTPALSVTWMFDGMARPEPLGPARFLERAEPRSDEVADPHSTWWHTLPHRVNRGQRRKQRGASHGPYWHRRAQEGKPALHPGRGRRAERAAHPHHSRAVRRRPGRPAAGPHPPRGLDRERVGGALSGRARPRGDRRRPELRPDVRDPDAEDQDRSARCAGAGRGLPAGGVPPGASAVRRPAPCARAA